MSQLFIKNVSKTYNQDIVAVNDFCLNIKNKQLISVIGPKNSGKSTLIRIIAGLENSTFGDIYIDGINLKSIPLKDRQVVMMSKNYTLYPDMTVFDNMAFSLTLKGISKKNINNRIEIISHILGINNILNKKPEFLTSLQKAKVALGKLAVKNPKIFLLDAPLDNMPQNNKKILKADILNLFRYLNATFIYVSSDPEDPLQTSNKVVIIKDGTVQQFGTPYKIYKYPKNIFVSRFIGLPQINLFKAVLIKEHNEYFINLFKYKIKIPKHKITPLTKAFIDKDVIVGIRPEDVNLQPNYNKGETMQASVDLIEQTTNGICTYLVLDNLPLISFSSIPHNYKSEDLINISFNNENIILFDNDTEIRITI